MGDLKVFFVLSGKLVGPQMGVVAPDAPWGGYGRRQGWSRRVSGGSPTPAAAGDAVRAACVPNRGTGGGVDPPKRGYAATTGMATMLMPGRATSNRHRPKHARACFGRDAE